MIKYMYYSLQEQASIRACKNQPHKILSQESFLSAFKISGWPSYYPLIIILCVLVPMGTCTTDITLLNCPSQFNLTKANETQSSDVELINTFYSGFSSTNDNERIENIVLTGDTDDLWAYIKQKIVPFAIYGGVVFFVFLMLLYYCLFDKSFPPCPGLRRNALEKPYTKVEKRCMSYWLFILAGIIFSAGIVSFTGIPSMKKYITYTKCAMYYSIDIAMNGDIDNRWGGFYSLKNKIGNISSLLDSASTQVTTYISGDDWLVNNIFVMKNKNIEIYNTYSNAQLITPNPLTTETNLAAGLDYPKIDSVFIKTGLGPNGTFNTMVDDIDRGLRTTQIKSKQAYQIQQSAQTMVETTNLIKLNSVSAVNTLSMYLRQFEVLNTEVNSFASEFFDSYFSMGVYILQGVVGFVIVSSLLVIIGVLSTHFYQIFECRYMVHCGWFLYSIMYFGMLVLAFITLSLGTVGYYSCQYFNSSMTNQTSYYKIGQKYSQNIFNRLDVCILGDGNVLKKFSINNEMKTVTDLFTNISTYFDYDNPSSANYIDLAISTGKIQGWINAIEKYRLGVYVDSRPQETTNDNPNYAINQMNLYSNTGGGVPTCSKDRWVFDSANCTDSNEDTYVSDATISHGQALSSTRVICISLNEKLSSSNPSWTQSDLIKRYLQIRQSCPDAYAKIIYFGSTLINFRDSRDALYKGIKDQLQQLYTLNTNFNNIMTSFRSRVNQFYQSIATLNNVVSNQINGLLVTTDCRTVGQSVGAVYNIFCVNFMVQIVKIGICTLIMLITMMGAMCVGAIFGVRYANVQTLKRVTGEQHSQVQDASSEQKMAKHHLDKDIMFSERSHSSQEEQKQKREGKKQPKK